MLVAGIFLAVALTLGKSIPAFYSKAACQRCYDLSQNAPGTAFEFSACTSVLPGVSRSNLMTTSFAPMESPVPFYLLEAGVLVLFVIVYFVAFFFAAENSPTRFALYGINLVFTMLWMVMGNRLFELYLWNGCYVSGWPAVLVQINWAVGVALFAALLIYVLAVWVFLPCATQGIGNDKVEAFSLWAARILTLLELILSAILMGYNVSNARNWYHLGFFALMLVSILDGQIYGRIEDRAVGTVKRAASIVEAKNQGGNAMLSPSRARSDAGAV